LEAEVFARDASGARQRRPPRRVPAHNTLEDFDFTAQPGAEKPLILHLAQRSALLVGRRRTRFTFEHTGFSGLGGLVLAKLVLRPVRKKMLGVALPAAPDAIDEGGTLRDCRFDASALPWARVMLPHPGGIYWISGVTAMTCWS
jgi:hypothetical protein